MAAESGHFEPTAPDAPDLTSRPTEIEQPAPVAVSNPSGGPEDPTLAYSATMPSMKRQEPTQLEIEAKTGPASVPDLPAAQLKRSPMVWLVPIIAVAVIGAAGWALMSSGSKDTPVVPPAPVPAPVVAAPVVDSGAPVAAPTPVVEAAEPVDSGAEAVAEADPTPANEPHREVRAAVVTVEAEPECDIAVDGKFYRHSPGELELMPGRHTVTLTNKSIKFRRQFAMELKPGERRELTVRAEQGTLRITVNPFGEIRVDGEVVAPGVSFKEVQVWEGKHVVEAVLKNEEEPSKSKRKKTTVDVKAKGSHEVTLNLME
ncbi:MAG: hypothetical protein JNG84_04640 [Archangium sp.]|nr:hypothetical protein [Archangium sp.]